MIGRVSILSLTAALSGCDAAGARPPDHLPTVQGCFAAAEHTHLVVLEVASTPETRQKGLMGRTAMAENAGMLFTYDYERSSEQGFWMFQTLLPLDIAYLDEQGTIVSIRQMHPCASARRSDCPGYPSSASYRNAVEMNAGYFTSHKIKVGDQLHWDSPESCKP